MERLILIGLNHNTAPLEVREKVAFDAQRREAELSALREKFSECEVVLLCTCNRTEIYLARSDPTRPEKNELTEFLARSGEFTPATLSGHLYFKTDRDVAAHLFNVASSLDSMVLGETQILGQVREAYEFSRSRDMAGRMLHPLFQRAIAVGKQVLSETKLAEGRVSIASVAVDYARQIFDSFADKTALCIGAGKISTLVLEHLRELGLKKLLVCNRDPEKAKSLAVKYSGKAVEFEKLTESLATADIVITATGSVKPIISRAMFEKVMRRRKHKPVFLIDIALPRDIAPDVGELTNVYLYNLDDLQKVVLATHSQRNGAVEAANLIVAEHVGEFVAWHRARELGPMIDQLFRRSHAAAQEELSRVIGRLGEISAQQREQLEDLTRRIVNKLLHDPVSMLRDGEGRHGSGQYRHAVTKLFKLDEDDEPTES
jgi:glutamyl-tRNA reductase